MRISTRRLTLTLAVAVLASFVVGYAAAANLGVGGGGLGAGSAAVSQCDTDGAGGLGGASVTNYAVDGSNRVTSVTVGGIAAACGGGTLIVHLTDSGGSSIGSGTQASIGTPSQSVTISGTGPDADQVAHARVEVVGP